MARPNPYRRAIVTAMNAALASAAVAATAAGWAAFGLADAGSAAAVAQPAPIVRQAAPPGDLPFTFRRHHHEEREGFGQGQAPLDGDSSPGSLGQGQAPLDGSSAQGSAQPRRPVTSTRSSR